MLAYNGANITETSDNVTSIGSFIQCVLIDSRVLLLEWMDIISLNTDLYMQYQTNVSKKLHQECMEQKGYKPAMDVTF